MIFLAGFFLLLIIFLFSVFYGTLQEGFGVNDYHWVKDQYGEWVLQKRDRDENFVEKDIEFIEFDSDLPYVKDLETDTNGGVIDGHVQVGNNQMLVIEDLPDAIRTDDGKVIDGYIAIGDNKMVKIPEISVVEEVVITGKKPLTKETIPDSGTIPRGSYKINPFQMAVIPDAYYIYDKDTMAEIPDGYQASEDKTYIFKTSADLQNQIDRADSYSASDFSAYRGKPPTTTATTINTPPTSRDPKQFSLDGQHSSMTGDETYINTIIDKENPALREGGTQGTGSDYRASPSYSFYDNHTVINTTNMKNTPGMLGGFCTQNAHSKMDIEKKCATLDKDVCASTSCCVLLGNETCVAGNEHGPSYQDHYRNPLIPNRDYYYYKGKCYGNCKHH